MSGPAQDDSGFTTAKDTPLILDPAQLLANDSAGSSFLGLGDVTGGTVSQDENDNIVFTPDPNYVGAASFEYYALDDLGDFSIATVYLSVTPANAAPVAGNDSGFSTTEDTPVTISASTLLQNDTDGDGDALTLAGVSNAVGGSVAINGQGNVVFTPNANYNGAASFSYTVSDGNGGTTTASVSLTVTPVNDAPVANNNSFGATEDTAITLTAAQLLGNDSDVDGNPLSLTGVSNAVNGTVAINGQGNVVFTPAANYFGAASFQYSISDGQGGFATATVNLTVAPVNDKPIVVNDSFSGTEDTPVLLTAAQLLANDSDIEGSALTVLTVSNAVNGTVSKDSAGNITFTPAANYNGPASFQYIARDAQGGINTGTVSLTIGAVNDQPIAHDDTGIYMLENTVFPQYPYAPTGTPLRIPFDRLLGNDVDLEGNAFTITSVTAGTNGTVVLGYNYVEFLPDPGFEGPATFSYTISDGLGGQAQDSVGTVTVTVLPDGILVDDIAVLAATDAIYQYAGSGILQTADINGDGAADMLLPNGMTLGGVILGAQGELTTSLDGGSLATATGVQYVELNETVLLMADMNGDGEADIITGGTSGYPPVYNIYYGGSGFDAVADDSIELPFGTGHGYSLVSGDFNGDGLADIFVGYTGGEVAYWQGTSGGFNSTQTAMAGAVLPTAGMLGTQYRAMGMLDINGDGYDDLVTAGGSIGSWPNPDYNTPIKITLGNAAGTLESDLDSNDGGLIITNSNAQPNAPAYNLMAVGDVNGDGYQDMLGNYGGAFLLFGGASYAAGQSVDIADLNGLNGVRLGFAAPAMLLADLNNDGYDDIIGGGGNSITIIWGNDGYAGGDLDFFGPGPNDSYITLSGYGLNGQIGAADMDGDGLIDLILGSETGDVQVISGTVFDVYNAPGASIDLLNGTMGDDILLGHGGDDSLSGREGNDILNGGSGNDYLFGEADNDVLNGGTGNDQLYGGNGDDTLYGGAGDDFLAGDAGVNTMDGGDGSDIVNSANVNDVVSDSGTTGIDSIATLYSASLASFSGFENILLNGNTNINATGNAGDNVLGGSAGDNILTGLGGDDILLGRDGNDTYVVGRGEGFDTIYQGAVPQGALPGIGFGPSAPTDLATTTDTLRFGSGIGYDQLWFSHVGNDLRIDVIGESDSSVLLKDWYSNSDSRVDVIETVDGGHALTSANVEALVTAMAGYSAPGAGEFTLATQLANDLQPVFATTWA